MNRGAAGLIACVILWCLACPVSAQSEAEHRFTVFDHPTPMGPLRVAFRVRPPQERSATSRWTHEFLFAHPAWGYGYYVEHLAWSCRSREAESWDITTLRRWDGTEGSRRGLVIEGPLRYPVQTVLGEAAYDALLSRVLCDGRDGGVVQTRPAAVAALRQAAGAATDPWPKHKITLSQGPVMRVAVPNFDDEGRPESVEFAQSMDATYAPERDLGAEGFTLTGATIPEPAVALDYVVAMLRAEGDEIVRHDRLTDNTSYALDHLTVRGSRGLRREVRTMACVNRPDLVYAAWADYESNEEHIFAMRFINSLYVDCHNPTR